jgi:hypothetical protein
MYSLTYVSSATTRLTQQDLRLLLDQCNTTNRAADVTGMLLYKDGNFMQVLEGSGACVRSAYARIGRDRRHHGLITLLQGPIRKRAFPNWSMGFRDLTLAPGSFPDGYSEFMNLSFTGAEFTDNPTQAQALLSIFKQGMERRL